MGAKTRIVWTSENWEAWGQLLQLQPEQVSQRQEVKRGETDHKHQESLCYHLLLCENSLLNYLPQHVPFQAKNQERERGRQGSGRKKEEGDRKEGSRRKKVVGWNVPWGLLLQGIYIEVNLQNFLLTWMIMSCLSLRTNRRGKGRNA